MLKDPTQFLLPLKFKKLTLSLNGSNSINPIPISSSSSSSPTFRKTHNFPTNQTEKTSIIMESTPPSNRSETLLRPKSACRQTPISNLGSETPEIPQLSLDLIPFSSPKKTPTPLSPMSPSPQKSLPLRELLLLSPSPLRRSRTRLAERLEMAVEEPIEPSGSRKRCKNRGGALMGLAGCASPRNARRSRRRMEQQEMREEKELGLVVEEVVKVRKRRNVSTRSKKEKLSSVPPFPSPSSSPKANECEGCNLDRIGQLINDLIMWKDVAKSSLWFGFGSLCFLSSCFTRGIGFSIFSAISQLGLLFLGVSFFSNSIIQRNNGENTREFKLNEEDILRVARFILPATNLAISKTREVFSGEPSMTLKVAPLLLLGAQYGHFITIWRLCALGFFIGFTAPKLYSCYAVKITKQVENLRWCVSETWGACSHKKIVAASAVTAFWNLSTMRTRIFTAFIFLVIFRYYRQHSVAKLEEAPAEEMEQEEQQQQH